MTIDRHDDSKKEVDVMAKGKPITLREYLDGRCNVMIRWTTETSLFYNSTVLGHPAPEFRFPYDNGLLSLVGIVHANGYWHWNGNGVPRDGDNKRITTLASYVDRKAWVRIAGAWEEKTANS